MIKISPKEEPMNLPICSMTKFLFQNNNMKSLYIWYKSEDTDTTSKYYYVQYTEYNNDNCVVFSVAVFDDADKFCDKFVDGVITPVTDMHVDIDLTNTGNPFNV